MRLTGTVGWQALQHTFLVVEPDGTDVELVCELNSPTGEVWFDLKSLQVRRLAAGMVRLPGANRLP